MQCSYKVTECTFEAVNTRQSDGETERQRDRVTQVKDLLASGVPSKGLEAHANFWSYRVFDAG